MSFFSDSLLFVKSDLHGRVDDMKVLVCIVLACSSISWGRSAGACMIKDGKFLAEFEEKELKKEKLDYQNALKPCRNYQA
jgi:hypothetical protein